jgi:hypothetical protein
MQQRKTDFCKCLKQSFLHSWNVETNHHGSGWLTGQLKYRLTPRNDGIQHVVLTFQMPS